MNTSANTRSGRSTRRLLAVAVVALTVAAACGGSGKKATSSSATTQPTTATDESTTTTSAAPDQTAESSTTAVTTGVTPAKTVTTRAGSTSRATTATTSGKSKQTLGGGLQNVVQASTTTLPASEVQPGGTFTFLKPTDATVLDPAKLTYNGPTDGVEGVAIFDLLIYYNSQSGAITPQTATSLTSTDGIVWTLKIHPNIKFSDGTPYDAAAIKFNIARVLDPATGSNQVVYASQIQTMDVLDATTLKFTLKSKNGSFPASLAYMSMIGSPAAIQQKGDQFGSSPVGAGAFVMKSWVRGSQLTLVRNPTYWNAPLPYLDQVIIKPILDEQQRTSTLTTGAANMFWSRSPVSEAQAESAGMTPHPLFTNGGVNIYFNLRKAPFNDLRLRQAFAYAIDRTQYSKIVDNNLIPVENSIFTEQSPFYDPAIAQLSFDATKAQALFDAVAADNGGKVSFTLGAFNVATQVTQATYMQGILNAYKNVKVDIAFFGTGAALAKLAAADFDAFVTGNNFIDPEPGWTSRFICDANPSYTGWCEPKFDADVVDARATLDPNQRLADFKDAQKLLYAAVPTLYFERNYSWMMSTPSVSNFTYVDDAVVLVDRLWLKTHN